MKKYNIILYASTQEKREKGLMFTEPLNKNECALFIFPRIGDHSFWNKNVSYPLDIVFCDANNNVIIKKNMDAEDTKQCKSNNSNIKYVIETIKGAMDNVKKGDILIIENDGGKLYFKEDNDI